MKLSWIVLGAVIAAAAWAAAGTRAEAQNYPWCAQYSGDFGGAENCGFVSFDQCMDTVRGMGGFCVENNMYHAPGPAASPHYAGHKHYSDKPS
jgi:hypothetical protein